MFNMASVFTEFARLFCLIIARVSKKLGNEIANNRMQARAERWRQWTLYQEGEGPAPQ